MGEVQERVPLADRAVFGTADLDEAREQVARVFCPHRLEPAGRAAPLAARLNSAQPGSVRVNYLDYGADVRIEPGELESFFLVQIPLAGRSLIRCGGQEIVSTPALASLPSPTEYLDMRWAAGCPQLIVKFDRLAVEEALERMLGRRPDRPLVFDLGVDMTAGWARGWRSMADLLVAAAECDDGLAAQPLAVAHLEGALLTSLLTMQPSNHRDLLNAPRPAAVPKVVRRAMEFIEGHAHEPLTTGDVARAVAVSGRSLQEGFRRHLGLTPMTYLRDVRLSRVHEELAAGDPAHRTVTGVAARWGFLHQGRFAAAYRARYGQAPSQTLRGR
ncbi:transcriptional regulator [Planomonospora parontospora subsp. parontospora]|uniref:Transcriptional regulator n=2 Tax=Planomonospora parontospora TaxID=58119 RepID=A0AA37BMJ1_9ACTN|nr:AraC family transcriptional regulator [Planomonospora parontospora]GGK93043.1 transcriptional regulator [Planomonospora parontospora]GII12098.1 transcriptional regulator [Planomonospora parontospora subsp. parontospora]